MAEPRHPRTEQVRTLLRSRYDYLPSPPIATGLISRDAGLGPAAGKRVPCDLCLRSGYVIRRGQGRRLCPLCEGSGWRKRRAGDEEWDEYLERPLRGSQRAREPFRLADDIRRLSAQIERLEADEDARNGSYGRERYGWEVERRRLERSGSYRELERLLSRLMLAWPSGYWVLHVVYWRGLPLTLSPRHAQLEVDAVGWIEERMPAEIRVPPWLLDGGVSQSAKKRRTVHDLAAEGMSPGKIAFIVGLTRKKVKRILAGT